MQYVKIDLAIDSKESGNEKEKETFDKYIEIIANKSDYESIDYFWVVKEAKNVYESSLVVFGSNSATGVAQENKSEAEEITSEQPEPTKVTQKEESTTGAKRKRSII